MPMKVVVEPHNTRWAAMFNRASTEIHQALGPNVTTVHHIGSTAIPTIYAKPIIDILVEVASIAVVDAHSRAMEALGYEAMGEFGIPGRRYFRRDDDRGVRTHHAHTFEAGSLEIDRHLAFRDFLLENPTWAQQYSELKRRLVEAHPDDIQAYMDGKDAYIKNVDQQAAEWQRGRTRRHRPPATEMKNPSHAAAPDSS